MMYIRENQKVPINAITINKLQIYMIPKLVIKINDWKTFEKIKINFENTGKRKNFLL